MNSLSEKSTFIFKQGDSLEFGISLKDSNGLALNILTTNIKSQLRKIDGTLVDTMVITNGVITGDYVVTGLNTSTYPVGIFYIDFKMNINGKIMSSPTLVIEVQKAITEW